MPDVEKAQQSVAEAIRALKQWSGPGGVYAHIEITKTRLAEALSALTEEKPPEPEVWTYEYGDKGWWVIDHGTGDHKARVLIKEDAERLANLPTLEREHAALVSAVKRVVRVHFMDPAGPEMRAAVEAMGALT